jgi:hypothetical protein
MGGQGHEAICYSKRDVIQGESSDSFIAGSRILQNACDRRKVVAQEGSKQPDVSVINKVCH